MNIKQINAAILAGSFNRDELNSIWTTVKLASQLASAEKAREFAVGDKVSFTGRSNMQHEGTVIKVAIKNIVVNTSAGMFRVPANMLKAA